MYFLFQSHAPSDLYLMTKNPEDAPNSPDLLEIHFKRGVCVLRVALEQREGEKRLPSLVQEHMLLP